MVVGDERELPVGGGVVGDLFVVDGEGEREDRLGGLAVAGLFAGAAAFLLAEAFLLGVGDLERQPAFGAGAGKRVAGGCSAARRVLSRERGLARRAWTPSSACIPCSIRAWRASASQASFCDERTQVMRCPSLVGIGAGAVQ